MKWLVNEIQGLGGAVGTARDFASLESLQALCETLKDSGFEGLNSIVPKPQAGDYWEVSGEAAAAALKFYDGFWCQGGRDVAMVRAALANVKVISHSLSVSALKWYYPFSTRLSNKTLLYRVPRKPKKSKRGSKPTSPAGTPRLRLRLRVALLLARLIPRRPKPRIPLLAAKQDLMTAVRDQDQFSFGFVLPSDCKDINCKMCA